MTKNDENNYMRCVCCVISPVKQIPIWIGVMKEDSIFEWYVILQGWSHHKQTLIIIFVDMMNESVYSHIGFSVYS